MTPPLVTTEWLADHMTQPDLYLLDVSVANVVGKSPITYDSLITIPESLKVCIETELSNTEVAGIHVFPTEKQIKQLAHTIGFSKKSTLIVYDDQGIYSAPRAWWIFKSFGFENVFILDGGLPKWLEDGRATDSSHKQRQTQTVEECFEQKIGAVKTAADILSTIDDQISTVIDVRAEDRFFGRVPEPRPGVRSGHIPKSKNFPFLNVLTEDGLMFKPVEELQVLFEKKQFESDAFYIFSCGSGMTACIVLVAAIIAGFHKVSLYDGSWAEWGANETLPIELD